MALYFALIALVFGQSPAPDTGEKFSPETAVEPVPAAPERAHMDLEVLYADDKMEQGLAIAKARFAKDPSDADLTWMIARFMHELGERLDDDDKSVDKVAFYTEMRNISDKGLALRPGDPHLRFARGLANARLGTTKGVMSSLWLAKSIEQDWLAAAQSGFVYRSLKGQEQLPCDVYLALGIFYRLVPDYWIVKAIAGTRGDLNKSLDFLQRGNRCSIQRVGMAKELGVTQLCLGGKNRDEALIAAGRKTLTELRTYPVANDTDRIDLDHAAKLLANPSIACAYSRDGQQELDEKLIQKNGK